MKLLLINPPQKHTIEGNLPKYADESRGHIPPLGLLYTAAAVQENTTWQVQVVDMSVGDTLLGSKPDLVGITATTFTLIDVLDVAKQVKAIWDVPVVLGGIHPTIYPEETLGLPNIDHVFTGESEETFPLALDGLAKKRGIIVRGVPSPINTLPIPARHLIAQEKYYSTLGHNRYLTTMFTSRGCPYRCIFCHRETMGNIFRARAANQVIEELRQITNSGISEVLVYDDTFTVDRRRVESICKGILSNGIKIDFDIRMRVDHADGELLALLKSAGCRRIHYGVEAATDRILGSLHKGITIAQVRRAFSATKKVGIETMAYFIIGSPGESYQDMEATIEFAKELGPNYCHFAVMTPYPATPLYQMGLDNGMYYDYWREFARSPDLNWAAPYWPETNREVLLGLLDRAYRSFYWRPGWIVKEAIKTRSVKQVVKKGSTAIKMLARRG